MSLHTKSTERTFYILGLCLIPIGLIFLIIILSGHTSLFFALPNCYFHHATGLYCPGCGGTRAVIALLSGHPLTSFLYHPFVPYFFVMYFIFMIKNTLSLIFPKIKKMAMRNIYIYIGIAIILIQWIVKNLFVIFL